MIPKSRISILRRLLRCGKVISWCTIWTMWRKAAEGVSVCLACEQEMLISVWPKGAKRWNGPEEQAGFPEEGKEGEEGETVPIAKDDFVLMV